MKFEPYPTVLDDDSPNQINLIVKTNCRNCREQIEIAIENSDKWIKFKCDKCNHRAEIKALSESADKKLVQIIVRETQ